MRQMWKERAACKGQSGSDSSPNERGQGQAVLVVASRAHSVLRFGLGRNIRGPPAAGGRQRCREAGGRGAKN